MNKLGQKIHQLLLDNNLENPILFEQIQKWNDASHKKLLETKFADFLHHLGFDLSNDSIAKTPKRVIEFFISEIFYGLNYDNFPEISVSKNSFAYTSPLISQGISVTSTCEHHMVSIKGKAVVAYIPGANIIGLSKLNRVVDFFARRPQVQERMNRQIFVVLQELLGTKDVAIAINAIHNCIVTRGIEDHGSETLTFELGGKFATDQVLSASFHQLAINIKL